MTPRFVLTVRPEADEDVLAAATWYDTERPGLGTEFTHAVYFTVDAEGVLVLACLHVRRDPHEWQRRR